MGRADLLKMLIQERSENESLTVKLAELEGELSGVREQMAVLQGEFEQKSDECQVAEAQLREAKEALNQRKIELDEAGNIAEASLRMHHIFEMAQASADEYLNSVRELKERQAGENARIMADSKAAAERLLAETRNVCNAKRMETEDKCSAMQKAAQEHYDFMMAKTEKEAERYWNSLSERMESFYDAHKGIRELLSFYDMKLPEPGTWAEAKDHE